MSEFIKKTLQYAIDTRERGGMQTGIPKVQIREADAVRMLRDVQLLNERIATIEQERDALVAYIGKLSEWMLPYVDIDETACDLLIDQSPQTSLVEHDAGVASEAYTAGFYAGYMTERDTLESPAHSAARFGEQYANQLREQSR